jgi:hypothetical protein
MKRTLVPLLFGAGLCLAAAASPGLCVREGVLVKDGQPYRGIGANYFSLFARVLKDPNDASSLSNLTALAGARIPFVRFMCGGFWPVEQQLYVTNRGEFFRRLDCVVRCAETNRIGLIPSLFWNVSTVPDLVGEPLDQYGNPDSKAVAFIRRYTAEVVQRYQDSPAIWGWEFGNEYNLACDLPNASAQRPPVWPTLGTARERTARDELKFAAVRVAFGAFAETVRKHDPTRIILSGNAAPRPSAWHNVHQKSWTSDSVAQFGEVLLRDNPDPMNVISVHLYPERKGGYPAGAASVADAIGVASRCAASAGKPLFLGEFGVARQAGSRDQQQADFTELLETINAQPVPLAAFWVFDLDSQEQDWNVSFHNDRGWMIDLVARANARLGDPAKR